MRLIRKLALRLRGRVLAMGRPAQIGLGGAVLAAAVGLVWMIVLACTPRLVPATAQTLEPQDLSAAKAMIEARGISCRSDSGRLYVPADSLQQVRAMLAYDGLCRATWPARSSRSPARTTCGTPRSRRTSGGRPRR